MKYVTELELNALQAASADPQAADGAVVHGQDGEVHLTREGIENLAILVGLLPPPGPGRGRRELVTK